MSYQEYRAKQIQSGALYQDFITDLFASAVGIPISVYGSKQYQYAVGESRQGVEIKHDKKYALTGNLWIELGEKAAPRPGDYAESGINRSDNTWLYVIGDYDIVFVFPKNVLRLVATRYKRRENNTATSVGYLLPDVDARKYAALVLTPNKGKVVEKFNGDLEAACRELHAAVTDKAGQQLMFERREGAG